MSVKGGVGVYLFVKEGCFRVRVTVKGNKGWGNGRGYGSGYVTVRVNVNPNHRPKTAFFKKS